MSGRHENLYDLSSLVEVASLWHCDKRAEQKGKRNESTVHFQEVPQFAEPNDSAFPQFITCSS